MSCQPAHNVAPFQAIPAHAECSICLEDVFYDKQKGICKLQCGHFFHLACIGVAFNVKGAMVCPNCRKAEDSEWKYFHGDAAHIQPTSDDEASSDEEEEEGNPDNGNTHHQENTVLVQEGNPVPPTSTHDPNSFLMHQTLKLMEYQCMHIERNVGPFSPSMQHTYIMPSGLTVGGYNTFRYPSNSSPMGILNGLGYHSRLLQNMNGIGRGTGSLGAGTSAQGGMSNLPNIGSYLNIQPLPNLPSSSTPPNVAPEARVLYRGSSSFAATSVDPPPQLGLNMSIGGGPLYTSQGESDVNINSAQKISHRVPGSFTFPIDLDKNPDGESPN